MFYSGFVAIMAFFCILASIDDWRDRRVNKYLAGVFCAAGAIAVLSNLGTLSIYYGVAALVVVILLHFTKIWCVFDSLICLLLMLIVSESAVPELSLVIPAIPIFIFVLTKIFKKERMVPGIPFLTIGYVMVALVLYIVSS